MTRTMTFLCWIIGSALSLGGCVTEPDQSSKSAQPQNFDAAPSFRGTYSRPLSEIPPANNAETSASVHTQLGSDYFSHGRTDVALEEARKALQASSDYAPAYHLMGLVYVELEQHALADEAFRHALSSAPGDPDFNNSYGWFLCNRGRVPEAMSHFATAINNPYYRNKSWPYTNAGRCLLNNKNVAGAEIQFSKALTTDPGNSEALYWLAEVSYRRGAWQRAHDMLTQYHQRFGPSARSVWLGLRAARRLGERHAEASYTEQLRSRFANSPENALMMQGKYE
jgi:type IV pilus assembly protein PilF